MTDTASAGMKMKTAFITMAITFLCIVSTPRTEAQTVNTVLKRKTLIQQFYGRWECAVSRQTVYLYEYAPFGEGMRCAIQVLADGNVIDSVMQLYGYVPGTDTLVFASLLQSDSALETGRGWFVTDKTGILLTNAPVSSAEKISFTFETPDTLLETITLGNGYEVKLILRRTGN